MCGALTNNINIDYALHVSRILLGHTGYTRLPSPFLACRGMKVAGHEISEDGVITYHCEWREKPLDY